MYYSLLAVTLLLSAGGYAEELKAIVRLDGVAVSGNVTFTQKGHGEEVLVEGIVKGLTPGEHGFHVHAIGDITGGCLSTGSHFNPDNKKHGAPSATERHVGDLGNIEADATGIAHISIKDNQISLCGRNNILGRAIVVHSGKDDLGLGGNEESLKTGNAGSRVACGVIGILSPETPWSNSGISTLPSIALIAMLMGLLLAQRSLH